MRILVVEDEPRVGELLASGLRAERYAVDLVRTAEDALHEAGSAEYDAIVLDLGLPDENGLDVLRKLREGGTRVPILILSARGETADRIAGLDLGADDYMAKPFSIEEVIARLRALFRRGQPAATSLAAGDLVLDLARHTAVRANRPLDLTPKEFALLEFFLRNKGRALTRRMIAEHVWDMNFEAFSNVIDVHVGRLRRKVDGPFEKALIHTIRGVGYILREDA
jgi:two-component system copper resistance phosphate regulon response regulator CusR